MRLFSLRFFIHAVRGVWSVLTYPLVIIGNLNRTLDDYQIHGNSVQEGVPTPDAEIPVESVGDLITDGDNAGKYKIPVTISGKNLIDYKKAYARSTAQTVTITDTGVIFTGNYYFIIPCNIKAGTTVAFSCVTQWLQRVVFYSGSEADVTIWGNGGKTTTTKDIDKLYVYKAPPESVGSNMVFDNIQLELGSKTSYEPYIEPVTTDIILDAPLRKIGDYTDYIDFKNGKVVRNVKEVIIDGVTGNYVNMNGGSPSYELENTYLFAITNMFPNRHTTGSYKTNTELSNIIKNYGVTVYNTAAPDRESFSFHNGKNYTQNLYIRVNKDRVLPSGVTTIQSGHFKNWVKKQYTNGTPLTFYYMCEEPEEERIPLPALPQFKGTTIYEIDTNIKPSGMQVKYY